MLSKLVNICTNVFPTETLKHLFSVSRYLLYSNWSLSFNVGVNEAIQNIWSSYIGLCHWVNIILIFCLPSKHFTAVIIMIKKHLFSVSRYLLWSLSFNVDVNKTMQDTWSRYVSLCYWLNIWLILRGRRGHARMVVGFTITYVSSAYRHWSCELESRSWRGVLDKSLCDKVCQWLTTGWWLSPDTPVPSTNKTDRHDITEILLKVALNTIQISYRRDKNDK